MSKELDLRQIPPFNVAHAAEVNFIGEKLRQLPMDRLKVIHEGLHAGHDSEEFMESVGALIALILEVSSEELTVYMNRVLNASFDAYFLVDIRQKAHLFTAFFFNHLRREGDRFVVDQIDLRDLSIVPHQPSCK